MSPSPVFPSTSLFCSSPGHHAACGHPTSQSLRPVAASQSPLLFYDLTALRVLARRLGECPPLCVCLMCFSRSDLSLGLGKGDHGGGVPPITPRQGYWQPRGITGGVRCITCLTSCFPGFSTINFLFAPLSILYSLQTSLQVKPMGTGVGAMRKMRPHHLREERATYSKQDSSVSSKLSFLCGPAPPFYRGRNRGREG